MHRTPTVGDTMMRRVVTLAIGVWSAGYVAGASTIYLAGPVIGARLQAVGARMSGIGTIEAVTTTSPAAAHLAALASQAPARVEYRSPVADRPMRSTWGAR
jgi:hypothetical protein